MELPRAVSIASAPSTPVSVGESTSLENDEGTDLQVCDGTARIPQYGRQRQKVHDPARDISIKVLEKFSLITKFARERTSQLLRETHSNGFAPFERRKSNHSPLDYSHELSDDSEEVPVESPVALDPLEVAVCSLYQLFPLLIFSKIFVCYTVKKVCVFTLGFKLYTFMLTFNAHTSY